MKRAVVKWKQRGQREKGDLQLGARPQCGARHQGEVRPGMVGLRSIIGRASVFTVKAMKEARGRMLLVMISVSPTRVTLQLIWSELWGNIDKDMSNCD